MIGVLLNPVTLLLSVMSLQWVLLGGIELHYYALALIILCTIGSPRRVRAVGDFLRDNASWMVPYLIYTVFLSAVLHGSKASNMGFRQILYVLGGTCIAATLARAKDPRRLLRVGSGLGIFLFVAVVELLARRIGMSWSTAFIELITSGNLKYVMFVFLRGVFNALYPGTDMAYGASAKNGIAVTLLIGALLFRAASRRPGRDFVGIAVFGGVLLLLFLLNTRSVLIVAGVGVILALALSAATGRGKNLPVILLKVAAVAVVLLVAVIQSLSLDNVSSTMVDRFSFEDASAGERVEQIQFALQHIQASPWTGNGYLESNGYPIHNLFLSSWMHAGVLAFGLILFFYFAVLGKWIAFMVRLVRRPNHWVLPIAPEWIAALPMLPLFRVWLSGDGGHPFLGEWIALSAFFGCLLANKLHRKRLLARPRTDVYSRLPDYGLPGGIAPVPAYSYLRPDDHPSGQVGPGSPLPHPAG